MKIAGTDYTGIAYLVGIGLVLVGGWYLLRKADDAGSGVADVIEAGRKAADDAINYAVSLGSSNPISRAADSVASGLVGRDTSVGSLVADVFPSAAEQQLNKQWAADNFIGGWTSGYDLLDAFPAPGYVGTLPEDLTKPAIIFRAPGNRTLH